MQKKDRTIYIKILCVFFLPASPLYTKTPVIIPTQTTQATTTSTTVLPSKLLQNRTTVTSSLSLSTVPPLPLPVNQPTQKQLTLALKPQQTPPKLPPDHPQFVHTNNTGSVAFIALVAAGIAYLLNNKNPSPSDTQIKPKLLSPKKHTPSPTQAPKIGLAHVIDQQYARLANIATDYEQALNNNPFYQSGNHRTRIQKRVKAIKQWQSDPHKKIDSSTLNRAFSQYSRSTSSAYTTITADPVQRMLHKEIVSITNELAHFQTIDPQISGYLFNHAMLLMEIARSYIGNNIIVQAMNAADVCWEIIEAAHATAPDLLFSKEIDAVWHQYFVYSHATLPRCNIDWDQFELEKSRWYTMQKQCEKLVDGCGTFIHSSLTKIENDVTSIGKSLLQIATVFDNFLLNELFMKIDILGRSLRTNATKLAQYCKKNIVDQLQKDWAEIKKDWAMVTEFIQSLYNQIPSPTQFFTKIVLNSLALYLVAGLFSTGENPIKLETAAVLGTIMSLLGSSGIITPLLKTYPLQALIIGAALVTPLISPLIEEYRAKKT